MDADPVLEEALLGWCVYASAAEIASWYDRLRPELVTDGRRRVALEAVKAQLAATGTYDAGLLYLRLREDGTHVTAGTLERWSNAYSAIPAGLTGILEVLEDLAGQRAAESIKRTPLAQTGRGSLQAIGDALEQAKTPPTLAAQSLGDAAWKAMKGLEREQPRTLRTGIPCLDDTLGGFLPGQLVVVGGRTGAGKSVFGLRLGRGLAETAKRPCYVHALEMTTAEMLARLAADQSGVENWRVQHGSFADAFDREQVGEAYKRLRSSTALHFRDMVGGSSFPASLAAYEAWLAQHPDAVALVVDYLGLYREIPGAERRYQELGIVAHALKALAGRYGIVVIAVSQLSRAAAQDDSPQLHHLRESGDLEQDADVVLLLHVPNEGRDGLEVRVAKCRSGVAGATVNLMFTRPYCRIEDPSAPPPRQVRE